MNTARKTQIMHMSIRGEDFTRIAREFMLSDMPTKAWRLLSKGLIGDNEAAIEKYAPMILDGTMKLVGDEHGMSIVRCSAKRYIKDLKYIYAGRVRVDKAWWRPRAIVVGVGKDDAEFATEASQILDIEKPSFRDMREWARLRVECYARKDERVLRVRSGKKFDHDSVLNQFYDRLVIFERTSEPPFWWDEVTDTAIALKDFLDNGHTLDEESWRASFGDNYESKEDIERREDEALKSHEEAIEEARSERQAREREEDEREFSIYERKCEVIREDVISQAKGDFIKLRLEDGTVIAAVPRAPFMNWALRRTSLKHHAPAWKPIAPSGMKMLNDDPYHTDWFFGATHIAQPSGDKTWTEKWYHYDHNGDLNKAAYHEMFELQTQLGECSCAVVVGGADVTGVIGLDIVVLPNLDPKYVDRVLTAKAVITQAGGKLAHLSTVALEHGIPIMLVEDACTRFIEGETVTVCPSEGEIRVRVVQ